MAQGVRCLTIQQAKRTRSSRTGHAAPATYDWSAACHALPPLTAVCCSGVAAARLAVRKLSESRQRSDVR